MGKKNKAPKDVGDVDQVKEAKAKHRNKDHVDRENLKLILENYHVREFIWRLLSECHLYDFGFRGDNNYLNHLEGKREVGGWIIQQMLTADPKAYILIRDEAVSRDAIKSKGE